MEFLFLPFEAPFEEDIYCKVMLTFFESTIIVQYKRLWGCLKSGKELVKRRQK